MPGGNGDPKTGGLINFHLHMPHIQFHLLHHHYGGAAGGSKDPAKNNNNNSSIPKGCVAITVGQAGAEQQRFVIPVIYVNHPLFMQLLKEAEEEYGFDQKGAINIPCHVEQFCHIRGIIDRETTTSDQEHHHHNHHNHHHMHFLCFKDA